MNRRNFLKNFAMTPLLLTPAITLKKENEIQIPETYQEAYDMLTSIFTQLESLECFFLEEKLETFAYECFDLSCIANHSFENFSAILDMNKKLNPIETMKGNFDFYITS